MVSGLNSHKIKMVLLGTILVLFIGMVCSSTAHAVRLKDVASFSGVRDNDLVGYGLVVGLSGTGDGTNSAFTITSMINMLEKMGVQVDRSTIKPKNVAAVMVTAKMPVTSKPGHSLDITVSSIGDSKSLYGGVLLMTPLKGIDGKVYALAQGALTLGGYSVDGQAATATKNFVTVGRVPNGATVERSVPFDFNRQRKITINLNMSDFGTTMQVVKRVNAAIGGKYARAVDASTVDLAIPESYIGNMVPLMASLEDLEISPDTKAKVVVDEKTGTVVLGRNVRLNQVAIAHGNLQVVVSEDVNVSQPGPFAPVGAKTVETPETNINVKENNNRLMLVEGATLQELVDGLNSIGASPRDLISILRAMKVAGALHAELEVI